MESEAESVAFVVTDVLGIDEERVVVWLGRHLVRWRG